MIKGAAAPRFSCKGTEKTVEKHIIFINTWNDPAAFSSLILTCIHERYCLSNPPFMTLFGSLLFVLYPYDVSQ